MYERNILIVDDSKNIPTLYIPQYEDRAEEVRRSCSKYENYHLKFEHTNTIEEAIKYLIGNNIVDVLIIDYRFNNSTSGQNGTDLVKYIRSHINKHCRVIFYTMHDISSIPATDIISLVNNQIFKLVDKGKVNNEEFVNIIYDAAINCDIVVTELERFWEEYKDIFNNYHYTFLGEHHKFDDIITHIRMDDSIGRNIVEKLLHKALIDSIEY